MKAMPVMFRLFVAMAACGLLVPVARSQGQDALLAPCIDPHRQASERARLCRALGEAVGSGPALRHSAQEAQARALMEMADWSGLWRSPPNC